VQGKVFVVSVSNAPKIDGIADDKVWNKAKEQTIPVDFPKWILKPRFEIKIRALRDKTRIYIQVTWEDKSEDKEYYPWVWDSDKEIYVEKELNDDQIFFAFPLKGKFNANMRSGIEATWDVWQWMAGRAQAGYAADLTHVYTLVDPGGNATETRFSNGKVGFILRKDDEGNAVLTKRKSPKNHGKDHEPHFVSGIPDGSAADVKASGVWEKDKWTVEFSRKLDTGHPDDMILEPKKTMKFCVGILNRSKGAGHAISLPFEFVFQE